jgi:hypothetical protein
MLKQYVRNMARLEASMAKGYIQDECLGSGWTLFQPYLCRLQMID